MKSIVACGALIIVVAACSSSTTTTGTSGTGGSSSTGTASDADGGSGGGAEGGGGGASPDGASGDGSAEQLCVDTINMYRAMVGSPALTRWNANESCTDGQAKADSASGTAHSAFGKCSEFAQDECPGWPGSYADVTTGCLKQMWAEGPGGGHYENMKNAQYTQVSCGFYTTADGSVWATQDFR